MIRIAAALIALLAGGFVAADAAERPRLYTNEQYIEDVTRETELPLDDPKAMLAFVLESLPDRVRVRVYPTENYYYFHFYHDGRRYAGNIRLDARDRDEGKLHFAYYVELSEWLNENTVNYRVFGKDDGVIVEKVDALVYRVTLGEKSVTFMLNDLSKVTPPEAALGTDDQYLGPVFDESGIRFFLVFNKRLKVFHYLLDETIKVADELVPSGISNRLLIGRRTGFAFYDEHHLKRKILIGVFEGSSDVNDYFDGPFDQLPDNFLKGDELRQAILEVDPTLKGRIDRFGGSPDGESRFLIAPYMYYRLEEDLRPIHDCAEDKEIPRELYHACFVVHDEPDDQADDGSGSTAKPEGKPGSSQKEPAGK